MLSFRRTRSGAAVVGVGVALALVLSVTLGACSSSGSSSTTATTTPAEQLCTAWSGVVDAFNAYRQVDVINGGLNSVRNYVDDLGASIQTLQSAASATVQPQVEALRSALTHLADTLGTNTSTTKVSTNLSEIRTAVSDVNNAWNDLVSALRTECPGTTAKTVGS